MSLYPLKFAPILKEKTWGGNKISNLLNLTDNSKPNIGEWWQISDRPSDQSVIINGEFKGRSLQSLIRDFQADLIGEKLNPDKPFPILVKILDINEDLSLQVHPSEDILKFLPSDAATKSEFWYILDNTKNATIMLGLKNDDKGGFINNIDKPSIKDFVNIYPTKKNMGVFVESGQIHALGAGNLILEIQENSDTTYRLSDWGRTDKLTGQPRNLHTKEGLLCLDFYNRKDPEFISVNKAKSSEILANKIFKLENVYINKSTQLKINKDYCKILSVTDGSIEVEGNGVSVTVKTAETILLPANINYNIKPLEKRASFILTTPLKDLNKGY